MPNVNFSRSVSFATGFLTTPSVSWELGTVRSSLSNVLTRVTRNEMSSTTPELPSRSIQSPIRNGLSVKTKTPATKFLITSWSAKPTASVAAAAVVASDCRKSP